MYKLVALDLDGTLLKDDKTISKKNFDVISKARSLGTKIVLSTGRPIKGIEKYIKWLNLECENEYCVVCGGAVVENNKNGEVLSEKKLTKDDLSYLYNLSKKLDVNIHSISLECCITPKISRYSILESSMNDIPLIKVDFENFNMDIPLFKIMYIDEPEVLDRITPLLPPEVYEKYTVVKSAPHFLEFLNKEANKGLGVDALATKLGIKQEEVICIGDSGNDTDMIEYAGLGIAMENAFPEAKEAANFITLSNEEDGVAYAIKKFILDKTV